jgi:hypothetical protein
MIVLVVLVGLTALAAAGMMITDTELRQSENTEMSTRAFYVADAALNDFLGVADTLLAPSASYTFPDGTATVQTTQFLVLTADSSMILNRVTAVGTCTFPGGGTATRTVSRLVLWDGGGRNKVSAPGAFTSVTGLEVLGNAGTLDGKDQADPLICPSAGDTIPGVTVPDTMFVTNSDTSGVHGDPPIEDSYPTTLELAESLNIDWADVLSGSSPPFDYHVTASKNWPDMSGFGPDDWPVTVFDPSDPKKNNLAMQENGQGLLIVPGDLELGGGFHWDGVIMVGGSVKASGGPGVTGAVIAGLNVLLGDSVATTDLGSGTISFLYDSCIAQKAFKNLGVTPPVVAEEPGTWTETM